MIETKLEILTSKKLVNYDKQIGLLLFLTFLILYIYFALTANLDLIDGKHVLFMDEQITFDEVHRILSSDSPTSFLENVTYKGDHRYGKILYNATSLFSFVPASIWGESGQIISTRLVQTFFLIASYILISIAFLRFWFLRALLFIFLLTLPYTSYYLTMPKPEPLQIFFISLFLFFAKRQKFRPGKHWFFMGMALGAKISAFPIIVFYLLVSIYQERTYIIDRLVLFIKKLLASLLSILVGLIISEPMLLFEKFNLYLNSTWRSMAHGADDTSVTVLSWIKLINMEYSTLHLTLLILGVISFTYTLIVLFSKRIRKETIFFKDKRYLILFIGFGFLALYMLKVDRLWGFYLHIPLIFIVTGVVVYVEKFLVDFHYEAKKIKIILLAALVLLLPLSYLISIVVKADIEKYNKFASRTSEERHINKSLEYDYLKGVLASIATLNNKKLKVYYDPYLYLLNSNELYEIVRFWGFFTKWEDEFDVVVYYKNYGQNLKLLNIPKTNFGYKTWQNAIKLFDKFTTNETDVRSDSNELLYIEFSDVNMPRDINIYIKSDVYHKYINQINQE